MRGQGMLQTTGEGQIKGLVWKREEKLLDCSLSILRKPWSKRRTRSCTTASRGIGHGGIVSDYSNILCVTVGQASLARRKQEVPLSVTQARL